MSKLGSITSFIVMIILGVILFAISSTALITLIRVTGIFLLVIGGLKILSYALTEEKTLSMHCQVVVAVVIAVAGLVVLLNPAFVISLFPIFMGIIIALAGAMNLMRSFDLKKAGYEKWYVMLILSMITICFSVLILANPFSTMELLVKIVGVSLVYSGTYGIFNYGIYVGIRD